MEQDGSGCIGVVATRVKQDNLSQWYFADVEFQRTK
jgi:hypothetical protein